MNDVGLEYLTLSRAGAHPLGRRGAADRPRVGARRLADRDALRPRRADDRAARRRHAPAARDPAAAGRPRQHGRRRRARPGGDRGGRPRDRPRSRRRQPRRAASLRGHAARARAGQVFRHGRAPARAAARLPDRRRLAARDSATRRPARAGRVVAFRRAEGAVTVVGARRAQPEEPDRPLPARPPGRGLRRLGLRESPRSCATSSTTPTPAGSRAPSQLDVGAHDRIDGLESISRPPARRPESARPLRALQPGDLHQGLGRDPAGSSRHRRARSRAASRRATSPSTRPAAAARCAGARAGRRSTCSSWRTSRCAATPATAGGSRARVLAVRHRGKNIGDVLAMTVDEATVVLRGRAEDRPAARAARARPASATCGSASRRRRSRAARRSA